MIAWILGLLMATQPNAPWQDTYPATAAAMAASAQAEPLFSGPDGAKKTATLYVSISWFESRHNPKAEGDHDCLKRDAKGVCVSKGAPHSFCLGQINDTNFAGLGVTKDQVLGDVAVCLHAMNVMIRQSFRVCAREELEDRLSWYTAGGNGCRVNVQSKHRMRKALWLFANHPMKGDQERDAFLVLPEL
jgi:hypothetical protein